jgi:hypothetical protein
MTIDELRHPVVCFAREGSMIVHRAAGWYRPEHRVARDYFIDLRIVDSDGNAYTASVGESSKRTFLSRLPAAFGVGERIKVEVSRIGQVALEDLRKDVLQHIEAEKEFWDSRPDFPQLLECIRSATTVRAITEPLAGLA